GRRLGERAVVAVVAEPGRNPHEWWRVVREIGVERIQRNDVVGTGPAVVRERVVLQRVGVGAVYATRRRQPLHVRAPADTGCGELHSETTGRQRVVTIVGDPPGASGRQREVVRETR